MTVLDGIPIDLDKAGLADRLRIEPGSDDARDFDALLAAVRAIARPRALYRECDVEPCGGNGVKIGGRVFFSAALRGNLAQVRRVFAFVATCGREPDAFGIARDDFVRQFWLDAIKAALLSCAIRALQSHLEGAYALHRSAAMSPGSGDATVWPIEQQTDLFALLGDVRGAIGVELTDSCLMIPNKTVSGIRFPTERDFRTCQLCRRGRCPNRGAAFDAELWKAMGHHDHAAQ